MLNQNNLSKTATQEVRLPGGLPKDIWIGIATYLRPQELENFKLACRVFLAIGQADKVLKPIYNQLYARLRKLAPSLPENLSEQNYQQQYQSHLKDVSASFNKEVLYLRRHHKDLVQTQIDTLVLTNLPTLKRLEKLSAALDNVNADIIRPRIDTSSSSLDLSGIGITRQPESLSNDTTLFSFWTSLERLDCCRNKLTKLDVQGLNALKCLDCSENKLTTLNVQGLNELEKLYCKKNELTTLNVQGLNALECLDCSENKLTTLNVQGLNALERLSCAGNKLATLNVQGLNELRYLYCEENQLTDLNVQGLNVLRTLRCVSNQLTNLNVQGLNALTELECKNNRLTTLPADAVKKFGADWEAQTLASQKPVEPVTPFYQQESSRKRNDSENDAQAVTEDTDSLLKQTTKKPRLG